MLRYAIPAGLIAVLTATAIFAQSKAPTTRPAGNYEPGHAFITVKSVSGIAKRWADNVENSKWKQMKVGDMVPERSVIRTGRDGRVILQFADRGDVMIERKTEIVISSFSNNGELVTARLDFRHGAILAQMDSSKGTSDIRVRTAGAAETLAGRVYEMSNCKYFALHSLEPTAPLVVAIRKDLAALLSGKPAKTTTKPAGEHHGGLTEAEINNLLINSGTTKPACSAKPAPLKATVKSVSGIAERRDSNVKNSKWERIKVGDMLHEYSLVRTGIDSEVVLKFPDRDDVTIKSATKIGICSFRKNAKTRLGLKCGAIRAKVDSSQGDNDFRVRTAVGTLAAGSSRPDMAQWGNSSLQQAKPTTRPTTKPAPAATTRPAGEHYGGLSLVF